MLSILLCILAAILIISGIFAIVLKQPLWSIVLIAVGLIVGPSGSFFGAA